MNKIKPSPKNEIIVVKDNNKAARLYFHPYWKLYDKLLHALLPTAKGDVVISLEPGGVQSAKQTAKTLRDMYGGTLVLPNIILNTKNNEIKLSSNTKIFSELTGYTTEQRAVVLTQSNSQIKIHHNEFFSYSNEMDFLDKVIKDFCEEQDIGLKVMQK